MQIDRIVLCYPDMDRIIVDKVKDLEKYDLSKVSSMDVTTAMSLDEFNRLRAWDQQVSTGTSTNVKAEPKP